MNTTSPWRPLRIYHKGRTINGEWLNVQDRCSSFELHTTPVKTKQSPSAWVDKYFSKYGIWR